MKTKNLLNVFVFCSLLIGICNAQISFEKTFGVARAGIGRCVQQTLDGGYIIVGTTFSSNRVTAKDIYLIKTDSFGDTLWTRLFGTETADYGNSVQQTIDGGYIVVGTGTIINPQYNTEYIRLLKTNSNGERLWEKEYIGLNQQDYIIGRDVKQTTDGSYVIIGYRNGQVYLIKTNSSGDTLWTKKYQIDGGSLDYSIGNFIEQTSDGGYIVSGTRVYTQSASPFLLKINKIGDTLWTKIFDPGEGRSVQQTSDGGYIFVTGGGMSGLPFPVAIPNIYKTDASGNLLWYKAYSDQLSNIYIKSVQRTSDDGFILAGSIGDNLYLMKTNQIGDTLWTRRYEMTVDRYYQDISVQEANDGGYVIAGDSFDFTLGEYKIYLIKALSDGSVLPVELKTFSGNVANGNVILNWSTATEMNNGIFEIERRKNNPEFLLIGYVDGHGTTTEPQKYSYTDRELSSGKYQYRLKQIDFDGSFEYSNVIEVEVNVPKKFALEQNYPNPFNPSTVISYQLPVSSRVTLKVYDLLGKEVATLVNEDKPAGSYEVEFNASSLTSGVYFYRIQSGDFVQARKMILLR